MHKRNAYTVGQTSHSFVTYHTSEKNDIAVNSIIIQTRNAFFLNNSTAEYIKAQVLTATTTNKSISLFRKTTKTHIYLYRK